MKKIIKIIAEYDEEAKEWTVETIRPNRLDGTFHTDNRLLACLWKTLARATTPDEAKKILEIVF